MFFGEDRSQVSLKIYDAAERLVRVLADATYDVECISIGP